MYECTICGQTRGSVSSNPQYDFRRPSTRPEERTVVGTSDHCSKCQQLTFFINLEESEDEVHDEQTGKNAPDWVLQGVVQPVGVTSSRSDLLDNNPHPPPKVPALQERHYLRKKPPLTPPTQEEKTPLTPPLQSQEQQHQDLGENPASPRTTPTQSKKKQRQAASLTPRSASIQQRHYSIPRSSSERRAGARQRRRRKRLTKSMASKVPADSCCHFKDLGNLSSSKTTTTTTQQQQQSDLERIPIYPREDMHMQQIARYRKVQPSNEESSIARSLQQGDGSGDGLADISTSGEKPESKTSGSPSSQNSLEHLQRTIEAKRKVMENLNNIQRRMQHLEKRNRLAWSIKKCPQRQCGGALPTPDQAERLNGGEVDKDADLDRLIRKSGEVDKGAALLGEQLLDVIKEKSGFSNDTRESPNLQRESPNLEDTVQQETKPKRLGSIVQRCNYQRIFPVPPPGENTTLSWPAQSQFSTVNVRANETLQEEPKTNVVLVEKGGSKKLKRRRDPIQCPEGDCPRLCFVSSLITHLRTDHHTVTVDGMALRQTKTFFLDPNETRLNQTKCHRMFLLPGKTISSMFDEPLDLLPVLFMSVRTRHRDLFVERSTSSSLPQYQQEDDSHEMLLLWLSTLQPTGGRLCGTLAVRAQKRADTTMVATGSTYDLRASLKIGALFASSSVLIIPHATLQRLSKKRKQMIIIQAKIY
ncbi:uncharacterized protein [Drosophila pseudoobscura]|uniref:DUF4729 domain-containing protein n=1 Tax=Drosophila pseudoobscura pseudoobscura TaxID=46245 RepID=A0A6I8V0R7_DROPS|nr:uncharacterized protein LOC6901722 [Drosophila pseudoobscura]XP_015042067.2 uncharacterized protein LOC6901722 [Drosophila pseudoobscura]